MDEYLSEKEQIERIKGWWNDNGWYLIGGVVIGLAGLFGYNRYNDYTNTQSEEAAAIYLQLESAVEDDNLDAVNTLLARLRNEYSPVPGPARKTRSSSPGRERSTSSRGVGSSRRWLLSGRPDR